MPITAQGYLNCLRSYLHGKDYILPQSAGGQVLLKEKGFVEQGTREVEYTVKLDFTGEAIVIRLDLQTQSRGGKIEPAARLFHFLDDNAKPWSKRCDFVLFNLRGQQIFAYCLEMKSESIPVDTHIQLQSSLDWIKSLHAIIKAYTGQHFTLRATKYVLTNHPDPSPYLEGSGRYLNRDHTVRHYHYSEINGMALQDLDNTNVEIIR